MGNTLPSLFQARNNTLPPMNTKHWSRSMKLLARALRRSLKRPCRVTTAQVSSRETLAVHHATSRTSRTSRTQKNGHHRRRVVGVKVVLTRAEAAQLLSLTEHGDPTAAQIVREFKRMQVNHANASAMASTTAWWPVLESIPEEWPY